MPISTETGEPLPDLPEPKAQPPPAPTEPTATKAELEASQSPFRSYDGVAPARRSQSERERKIDALTASIADYRGRMLDLRDCESGINPREKAGKRKLLTLVGERKKLERKVELWLGLKREIELSLMMVLKNGRLR